MPLSMSHVGPLKLMEVVYSPGHIFINSEAQENRDIHLPMVVPLPEEADIDGFAGFSVGHWDGDTLVIESTGFLDDTDLFPGVLNGGGLRISERIHLVGPNKLEDEITLSGAAALTKPYTYKVTFTRHREWSVAEYVCLAESHAIYKVDNYKPTKAEMEASTDLRPPVRVPLRRPYAGPRMRRRPIGKRWQNCPIGPASGISIRQPNEAVTGEFIPLTA